MAAGSKYAVWSGRDVLPEQQHQVLQRAIRLQWISIGVLSVNITMIGLVMGQSQAMQVAWIEDMLALLPAIAFLIATRVIRLPPSREHPYGHHRAIGVAHLVSAVALLFMGAYLLFDSALGLVMVEKPPIGIVVLFGHDIWSGWLMIAAMAITIPAMVILGRMKLQLAEELHDKVLYADADMMKADWLTGVATILGVAGIGVGWWWADAVAAALVASTIVKDGIDNVRSAILGLTDTRARHFDDSAPHVLTSTVERVTGEVAWVAEARARVRDEGHVFHVEMFVVPIDGFTPTTAHLGALRRLIEDIDWKVHDVVVALVEEIRDEQVPAE